MLDVSDMYGIFCVTGQIGGGKTYAVVATLLQYLAHGKHIYTNIKFLPDGVDKYLSDYGVELDWKSAYHYIDSGLDWQQVGPNSVLAIDEFSEFFDAADREGVIGKTLHTGFVRFLRQSRKAHIPVFLIGQSYESLNAQIRRLITLRWQSRDCYKIRIAHLNIGHLPYFRSHFYVQELDGKTKLGRGLFFRKNRKIWDCYDTTQIIGDPIVSGSASVDVPRTLKPRNWSWLGLFGLLGVIPLIHRPAPSGSNFLPSRPDQCLLSSTSSNLVSSFGPRADRVDKMEFHPPPVTITTNISEAVSQSWGASFDGKHLYCDIGDCILGSDSFYGILVKFNEKTAWFGKISPGKIDITILRLASSVPAAARASTSSLSSSASSSSPDQPQNSRESQSFSAQRGRENFPKENPSGVGRADVFPTRPLPPPR